MGQLEFRLTGDPLAQIAIRNVFDPSQTYLVDCAAKNHTLPNGDRFCDELTLLPPGIYDIVVQSLDPNCRSELAQYKISVEAGQTIEVPVTLVCGPTSGGTDVVVTEVNQPGILGVTFQNDTNNLCQACPGGNADIDVQVAVFDADTACSALVPQWSATGTGGDVTSSLLSNLQLLPQLPGGPCVFQATVAGDAALGDYDIRFSVADGVTPTSSVLFPLHLIDCGCP